MYVKKWYLVKAKKKKSLISQLKKKSAKMYLNYFPNSDGAHFFHRKLLRPNYLRKIGFPVRHWYVLADYDDRSSRHTKWLGTARQFACHVSSSQLRGQIGERT